MRQILLKAPGELAECQVPSLRAASGEALLRIRRVGVYGSAFYAGPAGILSRLMTHCFTNGRLRSTPAVIAVISSRVLFV
jgi:hypothetical protein